MTNMTAIVDEEAPELGKDWEVIDRETTGLRLFSTPVTLAQGMEPGIKDAPVLVNDIPEITRRALSHITETRRQMLWRPDGELLRRGEDSGSPWTMSIGDVGSLVGVVSHQDPEEHRALTTGQAASPRYGFKFDKAYALPDDLGRELHRGLRSYEDLSDPHATTSRSLSKLAPVMKIMTAAASNRIYVPRTTQRPYTIADCVLDSRMLLYSLWLLVPSQALLRSLFSYLQTTRRNVSVALSLRTGELRLLGMTLVVTPDSRVRWCVPGKVIPTLYEDPDRSVDGELVDWCCSIRSGESKHYHWVY